MPAIIELNAADREKLIKLLKNLNLGFTFSGFAEAFTAMLDGAPVHLSDEQKRELPVLINNLNLGFAHLDAGRILAGLVDATTQKATAAGLSNEEVHQLTELLNHLNLTAKELDIGGMTAAAVTAIAATAGQPAKPKATIVAAPAMAAATGGDTVHLTDMFTLTGITPAQIDFAVNPTAAGSVNAAGDLILAANASGKVEVTATVKAAEAPKLDLTGSGSKFTITAVTAHTTPKPKATIVAAPDKATATGGDTIHLADMFTLTGITPAQIDFAVNPTAAGSVNAAGDLILADNASGKVEVTATVKAAEAPKLDLTGSGSKFTITAVTAHATPPKTFKVVDGDTTGFAANKVTIANGGGAKKLTVTDSADAPVPQVGVALVNQADSAKLAAAIAGKDLTLTPVAGQTGDVAIKVTAAGYTDLTITVTIS
ncbi:hypothetical protein E3L83_05595 [Salmonella enterica]|nr:hypothetical protein [Salmonella enterica]